MSVSQTAINIIRFTAQGDSLSGQSRTLSGRWVNPNASAGNQLLVSDGSGNRLVNDYADGSNYCKEYLLKGVHDDVTITTMQGTGAEFFLQLRDKRNY